MSRKNRTVLRNYFRSGQMPTEEHFQNLIDSSLNLVEEGFDRSPESGFKISTMGAQNNLFSFYKYNDGQSALWNMQFAGDKGKSIEWTTANEASEDGVVSTDTETKPTLVLDPNGRVGIGRRSPRSALDVAGIVRSEGRVGGLSHQVSASSKWYPITEPLAGCHGFEVTAGVGGALGAGKYALLHATALKAYFRKGWFSEWLDRYRGIKINQACYRTRHNRLRLSWRPAIDSEGNRRTDDTYQLFIKTNCPYGDGKEDDYKINVHLSRLWDDPYMNKSRDFDNLPISNE